MTGPLKALTRFFGGCLVFGAIWGLLLLATACLAEAQGLRCLPRSMLTEKLTSRYGETFHGRGVQSETQLIEIWTSREHKSFTIFLTRPDGMSCILATGLDWFAIQPPAEGIDG